MEYIQEKDNSLEYIQEGDPNGKDVRMNTRMASFGCTSVSE